MAFIVTIMMLFLCTKPSFADGLSTVIKKEASNNAWTQDVFTNLISNSDIDALYSIASGHIYSGGTSYANNYGNDSLDASGYGGLIYESSSTGSSAVTIALQGNADDTVFSGWKLRLLDESGNSYEQLARGGVLYGGSLIITGSATFEDNYVFGYHVNNDSGHYTYGGEGGAIYANNLTIDGGSVFSGNFADSRGGAIAGSGALIIGENTTFQGNVSNSGGAISNILSTSSLIIGANSSFTDNRAYYGGAIAATTGSTVTINDGTVFTDNMAEVYGGALYVANVNFNYTGTSTGLVISSGNTIATLPKNDIFDDHIEFTSDNDIDADDLNNGGEGGFLYLRANGTATFNVSEQYNIIRIGEDNGDYTTDSNLDSIASGTNASFIKEGAGILVVNSRLEDFQGTVWVKEGIMDIRRANLGNGATTIFAGGSSVASNYGDASYVLLNFYNDAMGDDYAENYTINGAVIAGRNGVVMIGTAATTETATVNADDIVPMINASIDDLSIPESEWTPERFASYNIPWGSNGVSSIILVREQHYLDPTGSLTADSTLTSATSVAANTVNFGTGSLFIVDYDSINANLGGDFADLTVNNVASGNYDYDTWVSDYNNFTIVEGNAAIIGNGNTVLNVSSDSILLLSTADGAEPQKGDVYLVLEDFNASASTYWTSSQIHINSIGLGWDDMIGGWFGNDFYVVVRDVRAEDAFANSDLDPDLYDVLDEAASDGKDLNTDAEDAGERFISRVTDGDRIIDQKEQVKELEAVAKTTFVAAIPQIALSVSNSFTSALESRTSASSVTNQSVTVQRDAQGQWQKGTMGSHEREPQYGASLWAIGHYEHQDASFTTANFDVDYHASFAGVSFGGDYTFSENFLAGIAFHVGSGDMRSTGDFSGTNNDFDYAGLGLYALYTQNSFAVHADLAYTLLTSEISRALPDSVKASDKELGIGDGTRTLSDLTADNDTTVLSAGLRAEYAFTLNRFNLIPHLGLRVNHIQSQAYDVMSGREALIEMHNMDATIFQAPVGLTINTQRTFNNGWTMRPHTDLSLVAAFGDLEATQSMNFTGLSTDVALSADFADTLSARALVGFDIFNTDWNLGAELVYQGSESMHSVGCNVNLMYQF